MSNAYPAPPFGGPYPGYPFNNNNMGVRDGIPSTAPGGPPLPHHIGAYTASTPTNPSPAMNNHNFRANAAISNTNTPHPIPPSIPPPPFHVTPDLFRQFAHSSLPPPPHPPVPIPHLGFPHFPPPPPNFAVAPTPSNDHQANYSNQYQQHQVSVPSPPVVSQPTQIADIGTREEGELSDGELDESPPESMIEPSRPIETDQTDSSLMSHKAGSSIQEGLIVAQPTASVADLIRPDSEAPVVRQNSGASRGGFSESNSMGNVFQRPTEVENDRPPYTDNDSISSYNPPSASTPDLGEIDRDPLHTPSNGLQITDLSVPTTMNHPDNTNTAVREQVKDALRSLAPHNIKYNELVGEGVDPYLLQGLYAELDSNDVQLKAPCPPSHSGRDAGAPNKPLPEKQPALHVIGDLSGGSGQQAQQATKTADTESVLPSVSSVPETPTPQSVTDTVKTSASAVINSENSTSGAPPFIVAMERKDRIAQLLAAKTGKALPPRPTPEKQPLPSPKVTISESPVEAVKKPQNLPEKPPLPLSESSNRPRNKAQTELIRQKMEALKREALGKAQGEGTTKAGLITSSPISALPSTAPQLQQQRPPVDPADIETGGFEAQIPGLFMASEASPSFPNSTNGTAENVPMTKPVDAISVSSTGTPLSRGTSADIPSESVRSPSGQPLPVRVPQKRPLAADSFDEHALSNKRPFGRKESSGKVEIVISEGESEGEVEDVEMELDEESDEENRDDQDDVVPAVSIKQQNIRNLPPLTGMPPQKPSVQSAGRIGTPTATALQTPTSTGAQTPGKENDKEQLWKAKNQEIEQMRKKIAEMEERRKAKQNANLAKSPSAAGKAGLPAIRTSLARPSQPASSAPTISAPTNTQPAKQSVATEVEKPSDPMKSPSLAASKPDGLPSTPSTPLYAIREPLKADDLRQQLLARKFTRDTTPSAAEMEVRQAQLAEKRAKLAELRREAERREAEILEESKLLEAQLQAELNDESYEQPPSDLEGKVEDDGKAMGRSSSDVMPCDQTDVPGTHLEELPVAVTASPVSVPQTSLLTHETVLSPANEGDITGKKSMPSIAGGMFSPNKGAMQGLPEKPPSTIPSLPAKMATAPPHSHSPEVSVIEDGHLHISLPPPVNEEGLTRGTQPDIVEPNLVDDDGSVSMSDSASEDYEPAEPEQMHDDQAEDDSESYEPADPAISADPDKSSALQQEIAEPIDTEQNLGKGLSELTTSTNRDSEPPILLDDAEDGMQLTEPDVINKPQLLSQSRSDERYDKLQQPMSHFTPYETPRRYFKNFRYYDGFPEMVSSGYKSLTFSNNIDSRKPFCPTELAGKACEDPTCEEQHFRQIAMTGQCESSSQHLHDASKPQYPNQYDKILAQMSTANNLKTKAEHDRWVAGLRQVIADLRSKGVKDFHMVASALAAYRRRFSEELSTSTSASSQS